jgi:hypothetical protein
MMMGDKAFVDRSCFAKSTIFARKASCRDVRNS